jgi:hypothetical protein
MEPTTKPVSPKQVGVDVMENKTKQNKTKQNKTKPEL